MKRLSLAYPAALAACLLVASAASAAEVTLNAVQYPERTGIDLVLKGTERAPAGAKVEASVRAEGAQTRVEVSYKGMKPALLFGGDITSYVTWAVTSDGIAENLGELPVTDASGSQTYQSGKKVFGLMVTAEPFPGVTRPTDLVLFTNEPPKPGKTTSAAFAYGKFMSEAKSANPSIATMEWNKKTSVVLEQAKAVYAMGEKVKAGDLNPKAMGDAKIAIAQAENSTKSGGSSKAVTDYARRAIALSSEAIRDVYRKREADEKARLAAEQKAKEEALKAAALSEAQRRQQTEQALSELEALKQKTELDLTQTRQAAAALAAAKAQLEADKKKLEEEKAAIEKERNALAARLAGALGLVAETTKTARGHVVNLPGISFDTNKATLKAETKITLAKLSGILAIMSTLNIRVEGYTDSTGRDETNTKLSTERAQNVWAYLAQQGIAKERMTYDGYGPQNPVAPNDTADGRAKNRRVEIVLNEGNIEAAPKAAPAPAPAPAGKPEAKPAAKPAEKKG